MDPAYLHRHYLLKRQVLALTGTFRIFGPTAELLFFSRQKMFRLKEDIRVYSDAASTRQVLQITARQIIDFSATYDVTDTITNTLVGAIQRKGWRSLARDEWLFLSPSAEPLAMMQEDSLLRALLRRFLLGAWLPLDYHITSPSFGEIGAIHQRFNLLRYELELNLSGLSAQLDPRLAVAALILLGAIEGRQSSD